MKTLEIRYAAGHVVALPLPDGAPDLAVYQYARAIVHVTARRQSVDPVGANDVAAAIRAAGHVPELTEGDEVRFGGRRVLVCAAQHGAVLFTRPGPVPEEEFTAGAAAYVAAAQPRTMPGRSPYPSVRDGRWG